MPKSEEQRRFAQPATIPPGPLRSGYSGLVLERLAKQVCRIAGVESSCIFVRDRRDPRAVIVAAGCGVPADLLGARIGADEGAVGKVLATGEPLLLADWAELVAPLDAGDARGCAGAAVPI